MLKYIKKLLDSGNTTTLIILNDETEDIMKIVKSFENFDLLLKAVKRIGKGVGEGFIRASYGSSIKNKDF